VGRGGSVVCVLAMVLTVSAVLILRCSLPGLRAPAVRRCESHEPGLEGKGSPPPAVALWPGALWSGAYVSRLCLCSPWCSHGLRHRLHQRPSLRLRFWRVWLHGWQQGFSWRARGCKCALCLPQLAARSLVCSLLRVSLSNAGGSAPFEPGEGAGALSGHG